MLRAVDVGSFFCRQSPIVIFKNSYTYRLNITERVYTDPRFSSGVTVEVELHKVHM